RIFEFRPTLSLRARFRERRRNSCGCPRNCDRRVLCPVATEESPREGGRRIRTREPGDLPRAVVLFSVGGRRGLAGDTALTARGAVHGGAVSKNLIDGAPLQLLNPSGERHAPISCDYHTLFACGARDRRRHGT